MTSTPPTRKPHTAHSMRTLFATIFIASCAISTGATAQNDLEKTTSASAAKVEAPSQTNAKAKAKGKAKAKPKAKLAAKQRAKPTQGPAYATRDDVMLAAAALAQRANLDVAWVRKAIGQAHYVPAVARAITPPPIGMPKNWTLYRSRFIDAARTRAGVEFWQTNRAVLERAQQETGVPVEIIVGVIGVETIYGQQTGTYRVIDALCTLAFDFPDAHPRAKERAAFFLAELEAFLSLTQRTGTDPLALLGSYAGAMGLPQFMPSSWQKYAIDFDGDGRVDLFHSPADVIGSVANYFKAFGWQPGMPTHFAVQLNPATVDMPTLMAPDILPTFTAEVMASKGAEVDSAGRQHPGPLALVELQNGAQPPLYVAGTRNFYTITRYNWSSYYAMAVIELGQAVAAAMPK